MRDRTRNGLNSGMTFGVVILFLSLIGFFTTAVILLSDLTSNPLDETQLDTPQAFTMMTTLIGLLGVWAGILATKPPVSEKWGDVVVASLIGGLTAGLVVAAYSLVIGAVMRAGIDARAYLAALGVENILLFLFGKSPLLGALLHIALLVAGSLVGGVGRKLAQLVQNYPAAKWAAGGIGALLVLAILYRSFGLMGAVIPAAIGIVIALPRFLKQPLRNYVYYGLLVIALLALPQFLNQYWNYTLGTVGIYVLLGLGLNIVVGMAGLLDLGYVAFFAIGAYTVALMTAPTPHGLLTDFWWNFWLALPIGVILAALAGILLGIPVLRMRGDYLAIVTLGFGEIIRILSKSDALTGFSGGPRGVRDVAMPSFALPFTDFKYTFDDRAFIYLIILGCLLVIFVTARLQNSRVGRAWIAMREDETVAQAMGINTWQYKLMAFAIGAAFAGLGGVLFASRNQFTGPEDHNLMVSINVLSLVIVGGMGSIPGVVMGALALKGLPEVLRQLESFRLLAFGGLLVAMMILRPEGIWPSKRRQLEMHEDEVASEELEPGGGETP